MANNLRVSIFLQNRLLRDSIARILSNRADLDVTCFYWPEVQVEVSVRGAIKNSSARKTLRRHRNIRRRSRCRKCPSMILFTETRPGWRNGIRGGLKIPWSSQAVWVRPPPRAPKKQLM